MSDPGEKIKKFNFDFSAPLQSKVSLNKLKSFLNKDKEPILIFYGGEPLLEIEKIKRIIDCLESTDVKFRMQTNTKLLHKLPIKYLKKIDKLLVSIDGNKDRTDFNRGENTYEKVIENIRKARHLGFNGEIVARMVVTPPHSDIYDQIISLINLDLFDSIHWQLDAGFYEHDYNKNFKKFAEDYNKSINSLINYWINKLKDGNVIQLYPFIALVQDLIKGKKTLLRCGAGHSGYAISTDGKIYACPIAHDIKEFQAGEIQDNPKNLKKFKVKGKCETCSYLDICGGRCLYWNYAGLWPEEGDDLICLTIKHLIDKLKSRINEIKKLISLNKINLSDFNYEKYFGPEIIP